MIYLKFSFFSCKILGKYIIVAPCNHSAAKKNTKKKEEEGKRRGEKINDTESICGSFFFRGKTKRGSGETIFVSRLSFFCLEGGGGEKSGINHLGNRYLASAKKKPPTMLLYIRTVPIYLRGEIIPSFLEKKRNIKSFPPLHEHVLPFTGKNVVFFGVLSSQGLRSQTPKKRREKKKGNGLTYIWACHGSLDKKKRNDFFVLFSRFCQNTGLNHSLRCSL